MNLTSNSDRAGFSAVLVVVFFAALLMAAGAAFLVASRLAGADAPAEAQPAEEGALADYVFVSFGAAGDKESSSIVVNLAEARLTRYLCVTITLQVHRDKADGIRKLVQNGKSSIFKDWLIAHLSDKTLEEVKGAQSIARLRREILDGFNGILAELGGPEVESVLFEDFYVH